MKKLYRYLACLLIVQNASVAAVTEKTFLSNAPTSNFNYYYLRDLWLQNLELKNRHDIGGRVLLRTAYHQSYNQQGLGRYFGVNDKPNIVIGERINDASPAAIVNATTVDIDERFIIHGQALPVASGTVSFKPQHEIFTAIVSYEQSLNALVKGLWVWLFVPVEHVTRRLQYSICSGNTTVGTDLTNFFTGNFSSDLQVPLTNAKLAQRKSTTGLGDIELGIRYDIVNKQILKMDMGLRGIIPCANKPTGKFLFEPLRGHEGHGAIGFDIQASRLIYDNFSTTLQFVGMFDALYFFSTDQKRTLGIKNRRLGQYVLLGQAGQTKLLPAANVLTMPLRIAGYTELSASCGLNGNHYGWFGSLNYQLKTREEECIKIKNCWNNTTYAVSSFSFDGDQFGASPNDFDLYANDWITQQDLDFQAATTPGFLLHEIDLILGKVVDLGSQTLLFSAGFSAEFSGRNFPAKSWGVEIGIGVSF